MVKSLTPGPTTAAPPPRQAPRAARRAATAAPPQKLAKLVTDDSGEMGGARYNIADQSGQDVWHAPEAPVALGPHAWTVGHADASTLSGNRGGIATAVHLGAVPDAPFVDAFVNFGAWGANLRGRLPALDGLGGAAVASLAGAFGPTFAAVAPGVSLAMAGGSRLRLGGAAFLDAQRKIELAQPAAVAHQPDAPVAVRWHERRAPGLAADLAGGLGLSGLGGKLVGASWQEVTWQTHLPAATAARLLPEPPAQVGAADFLPGWLTERMPGGGPKAAPGRLPDPARPFEASPGHRELAVGDSLEVAQGERLAGGLMPGLGGLRLSAMGSVARQRHLLIERLDADRLRLHIDRSASQGAQAGADALLLASLHHGVSRSQGSTAELVVHRDDPAAMSLYGQAVAGDPAALDALLALPQVQGGQAKVVRQGEEQELTSLMPLLLMARSGISGLGQRREAHREEVSGGAGPDQQRHSVTLARHRLRAGSHTLEAVLSAPAAAGGPATLSIQANLSRASQAAVSKWAQLWAPAGGAGAGADGGAGGARAAGAVAGTGGSHSLKVQVTLAEASQQQAVRALLAQPKLNVDSLMAALAQHTAGSLPTVVVEHGELARAQKDAARLLLRPGTLSPQARAELTSRLSAALAAWQSDPLVAANDNAAHRAVAAAARAALQQLGATG